MNEIFLCSLDTIPDNGMEQFVVGSATILVCRSGDTVYAVDGICPHRGAQLVQGALEGLTVVCPWHDWAFDVETGAGITNPMSCLNSFPVDVRENGIYVVIGSI